MTRVVLTGWTGTLFAKMACHTLPLIESYAERHGAKFICVNLAGERPPSWHKVPHIIEALNQVDQVAWIDSDVVIERHDKSIFEAFPAYAWQAMVEHQTECGNVPNCGIWILSKPMLPVLIEAWSSQTYIDHPWWEQAAIIERMGYVVNNVNAHHETVTELYTHTAWLGPEWNHHPSDIRRVESPRFRHVTMYEDRLGVAIYCAKKAQESLQELQNFGLSKNDVSVAKHQEKVSEVVPENEISKELGISKLYLKNSRRFCPLESHLNHLILNAINSKTLKIRIDSKGVAYPERFGVAYSQTDDVRDEAEKIAQIIRSIPENSIVGLFGVGFAYVLEFLKDVKVKLCVFEPDFEVLNASFMQVEIPDDLDVRFVATIKEFLSYDLNNVLVNDATRRLYPNLFIELQEELKKLTNVQRGKIFNSKSLRVLVQARGNLYRDKGGDTVALDQSCNALRKLGVDVVIDPIGERNPRDFDLLHIYNFATPASIEPLARRALEEGVPFVATTLYEDRPAFFAKMSVYGRVMEEYIGGSLSHLPFSRSMEVVENTVGIFPDHGYLDNNFVASNANALFTSGSIETGLIYRDYPQFRRVEEVMFGFQALPEADPNLFKSKYGLNDYIICVGRIEWRKNQGMLLKALEDSSLDVVLVAGNMTYHQDYQRIVPTFKRKGRNLVVSGLTIEELSSAYRGARAHVLPSWYELPGLVSLEAASCGVPVVGTKFGTLYDYLGDDVFYCDPGDIVSIREAVERAVEVGPYSQIRSNLVTSASKYSWEKTAERLLSLYSSILRKELTNHNVDPRQTALL